MTFDTLDSKRLRAVKLQVGKRYIVHYALGRVAHIVRFIKATPTGHNFLDEATHTCLFRRLIYEIKNEKRGGPMMFIVPWNWVITDMPE